MKKFSPLGRVNLQDVYNGLLVAFFSGLVVTIYEALLSSEPISFSDVWKAGIISALGYLKYKLVSGTPKSIEIDTGKTIIIDKNKYTNS